MLNEFINEVDDKTFDEVVQKIREFTSFGFKLIFIILSLLDIIGLVLLEKQQVLKSVEISMFITSIISMYL